MHQRFPRLLVVSGSALLVKKNAHFRDPVCHNSQNNPTNFFFFLFFFVVQFLDADTVIQDLFTAPFLWNQLGLLESKQAILDKAWKDIAFFCFSSASLLLHLWLIFFFSLSPFVMPGLLPSRSRTKLGSGEREWLGTTTHDAHGAPESVYSPVEMGEVVVVFVLEE